MIQSTINLLNLEADAVLRNAVAQHEKDKGASGQRFTATQKRTILDKAVELGGQGAAAEWWNASNTQKVSQASISRWASSASLENLKPGTKNMLSDTDLLEVFSAFDRLRDRAIKVDYSLFAKATRGIMKRLHPDMFRHGDRRGYKAFSSSWARSVMTKGGLRPARATTNRTVQASDIVVEGKKFYNKLKQLNPHPALFINANAFFCLLSGDSKRWTWYRKCGTGPQNVAIREDRVGFTACAVTSATGALICLQLIWRGKTTASEARMQPHELNSSIIQCHNDEAHFQNERSWGVLLQQIKRYVAATRIAQGISADVRGAFIYDHAPQHGSEEAVQVTLQDVGIDGVLIPKKMTHVFQPCDMYIIACIKSATDVAWKAWIESCFAEHPIAEAVKLVESAGSATVKKQKYEFLSTAIKQVEGTDAIVASWEASGAARAIGMQPRLGLNGLPKTPVLFDAYVEIAKLVEVVDEEDEAKSDEAEDLTEMPMPRPVDAIARRVEPPRAPLPQPGKKGPGRPKQHHPPQRGPTLVEMFARKKSRTEGATQVPNQDNNEADVVVYDGATHAADYMNDADLLLVDDSDESA